MIAPLGCSGAHWEAATEYDEVVLCHTIIDGKQHFNNIWIEKQWSYPLGPNEQLW